MTEKSPTVAREHNADKTGLFFNLQPSKSFTFCGDPSHGGTQSEQQLTVFLPCNADGSDKTTTTCSWLTQVSALF
jgi:hypothetical protein